MTQLARKRRFKPMDEKGQSTVEFALSLIFMMGFVLFFIQLSFLFAYGNLVHYATFMAARSYLAAGETDDDQVERAKDVIIGLLKKSKGMSGVEKYGFIARGDGDSQEVPGMMLGDGPAFNPKDKTLSWMQGVRYTFKGSLTAVPLGGAKDVNFLKLKSESWLGRESSAEKCKAYLNNKYKGKQGGFIDNGC